VLRGHATFELDGTSVDAPTGTFVFAPPGTSRSAVADEAETEILMIEGTPGKAYDARGWEIWAPLAPLYASGRHEEVAERLKGEVEAHPEYGLLFFNLACSESLLGRTADALQHLRRAIDISEEFREYAKHDEDLVAIREESAFKQMTND
jgi:tetratricopeptide (TPR) repeat protein